jgi:hypothetical protein
MVECFYRGQREVDDACPGRASTVKYMEVMEVLYQHFRDHHRTSIHENASEMIHSCEWIEVQWKVLYCNEHRKIADH